MVFKQGIIYKLFKIFLMFFAFNLYSELYPVVIIGGGVGGLYAGTNLARMGIDVLVIDKGEGESSIYKASIVKNCPKEKEISGKKIYEDLKGQAKDNRCDILIGEVVDVDLSKKPFELLIKNFLKNKINKIKAQSLIIATGARAKSLKATGEKDYVGKGISYCTLCDGNLYSKKTVAIIGSGNIAISNALYMSDIAKKVFVIVKGEDFKRNCDKMNKDKLLSKKNITVLYKQKVLSFSKKKDMFEILLQNEKNREKKIVDGVFISVGYLPNSGIFKGKLEMDREGYIVLKEGQKTSVEGVFAIGDVVNKEKTIAFALSDAMSAAMQDFDYLKKSEEKIIDIIDDKQFEREIVDLEKNVLIEFYASWCGPCKRIYPILKKKIENCSSNIKLLKVDIDKLNDIAKKYDVRAMPTLIALDRKGKIKEKRVGFDDILEFMSKLK
ncbi:MAG: hypothetical protein AMS24_00750 [Chlamydiae bacterium SM23_39]|nr:MAG: hypothetical protein AMS24_00750 [Chlamydiae bacterium SM23_39]